MARPRTWTRERIFAAIRREAAAGRSLRKSVVADRNGSLVWAARTYLGSWRNAVRAAGLEGRLPPPDGRARRGVRAWTRKELLRELRKIYRKRGRVDTGVLEGIRRPGCHALLWAVRREFGTMARARKAAGTPKRPKWTRADVTAALRALARKGEPLTYRAARRTYPGLPDAAEKRFGGWRSALREAGIGTLR